MNRQDITFDSSGYKCAAWLYRPEGDKPCPAIVMAHGFAGTRPIRLDAYAERFCREGWLVLVFDYRHFGDSEGEPRQILDIQKQLADWRAALAYARALPGVDLSRIALWGTSFSGGHVIAMAAEDPSLAACVSQVPFLDGLANARITPLAQSIRLGLAAFRDEWRRLLGQEPFYVPAVAMPGVLAAMVTPDADQGYKELIPQGIEWRNEVAARIFLRIGFYRPVEQASRIRCPLLLCVADLDTITPVKPAQRVLDQAARAEIRHYPVKHFDIYIGEGFEAAVSDQIGFFRRFLSTDRIS